MAVETLRRISNPAWLINPTEEYSFNDGTLEFQRKNETRQQFVEALSNCESHIIIYCKIAQLLKFRITQNQVAQHSLIINKLITQKKIVTLT